MELEQKIISGVEAILGVTGLAVKEGFTFNEHQYNYALNVARGLVSPKGSTKSSLNILQAATGTGKTIAYLVPLLLYSMYTKKRVAVSTFTRQLQRQIISKDAVSVAGWVEQVTQCKPSCQLRAGIRNYVSFDRCEKRKKTLMAEATVNREAVRFLDDLMLWLDGAGTSGLIDDFLQDHAIDLLPDGVTKEQICLDSRSSVEEKQHYLAEITTSFEADLLVVNHALSVLHAYRWQSILDDDDNRPLSVIVFDEADRVSSVADSVLSPSISLKQLLNGALLAQKVLPKKEKKGDDLGEAANMLYMQSVAIAENHKTTQITKDETLNETLKVTSELLSRHSESISKIAIKLKQKKDDASQKKSNKLLDYLDNVNDIVRIAKMNSGKDDSLLISYSPNRHYPSLHILSSGSGRIMSRLWSKSPAIKGECVPQRDYLDAALFTSATLATPGQPLPAAFDFFSAELGIIRHNDQQGNPIHLVRTDLFTIYEPASFGKLDFVLADPSAPTPSMKLEDDYQTDPAWLDYCSKMIMAASQKGGRILILTLSWSDTLALSKLLEGQLNDHFITHKKGDRLDQLLTRYRSEEDSILITPSAWEGVNLPGMVDQLIVTRIPFAPLDNKKSILTRFALEAKGFSSNKIDQIIWGINATESRRRLSQGLGRAIRSKTDKATVWIGDPRFPLPESFESSFDPVILNAPAKRQKKVYRGCIPTRFQCASYQRASLFVQGALYHVS